MESSDRKKLSYRFIMFFYYLIYARLFCAFRKFHKEHEISFEDVTQCYNYRARGVAQWQSRRHRVQSPALPIDVFMKR